MKKLLMLVLGAVFAIATPLAHADSINQISFNGNVSYTPTGNGNAAVVFTPYSPTSTVDAQVGGISTGIFSNFTPFNPVTGQGTLVTFNNFNTGQATISPLFTATASNGQKVSFTVTSLTVATDAAGSGITGTGYYTFTAANGTVTTVPGGSFQFTTQGTSPGVTFSASNTLTNTVTPEPSSLVLLGTGLVSAAGMLVRRRRQVVL